MAARKPPRGWERSRSVDAADESRRGRLEDRTATRTTGTLQSTSNSTSAGLRPRDRGGMGSSGGTSRPSNAGLGPGGLSSQPSLVASSANSANPGASSVPASSRRNGGRRREGTQSGRTSHRHSDLETDERDRRQPAFAYRNDDFPPLQSRGPGGTGGPPTSWANVVVRSHPQVPSWGAFQATAQGGAPAAATQPLAPSILSSRISVPSVPSIPVVANNLPPPLLAASLPESLTQDVLAEAPALAVQILQPAISSHSPSGAVWSSIPETVLAAPTVVAATPPMPLTRLPIPPPATPFTLSVQQIQQQPVQPQQLQQCLSQPSRTNIHTRGRELSGSSKPTDSSVSAHQKSRTLSRPRSQQLPRAIPSELVVRPWAVPLAQKIQYLDLQSTVDPSVLESPRFQGGAARWAPPFPRGEVSMSEGGGPGSAGSRAAPVRAVLPDSNTIPADAAQGASDLTIAISLAEDCKPIVPLQHRPHQTVSSLNVALNPSPSIPLPHPPSFGTAPIGSRLLNFMPPQNYPSRVPAFGNNAEVFRSRPSKFFGVETLPGGFPFRSCSHTYSDSDSDEESTASEESIEIVVGKNAEALPTFLTGKAPPPPPRFIPPPPAPSKQRPVIRRGRSSSSSSSTTPFLRNGPPDAPLVASRKPPQQQREQQHRQSLPPQHPSQPLPVSSEARVRNSDAFSTDGGPIAYSPSRRYSQPQLSVEGVADLRRVAGIVPGRSLSPPPALPSTYANSNMWNGIHPTPNGLGIPFGGIFGAWGSPPMSLWLAFTAMTMAQRQGTNQYPAGKAHRRSRASNAGGSHRQRMKGRWSATGWNKTCSSPKNRKSSPIISDSQQTLQSRVLKDINLQYTSAPQPFHSAVPAIIRAASPTPTSSAASEISMQDSLLSSTTFGTLGHAQRQYLFRMTTSPVPIGASTLPIYPSGSLSLPGSIDSYHLDPFPFPANGMFGTNDGGNSNVGTAMASPVGSDASTATAASASLLGRPQRPFPSGLPQSRGLGGIVDGGPVGMSRDADAMGSLSIALSALNLADTTGVAWPGSNGQGVPPFWPLHTANGAAGAARWRQQHFSQQPFAVTHGPGSNWVLQPPQVQSAPMLMSPPPPRIPAQQSLNTPASADTTASPSDRKIASVKRRSRALTVPSTECPLTPMAPQLACALPAFSQSEGPVLAPQVVTPSVLFSTPAPPLLQPPSGAVDEIVSTAVEQNMAKLSSTSTLGTLPQRQSDTLTNARLTSAISAASSHTEPTTATGNTKSGRSPKARGPTRTTEEKTPVSVSSPTPSGSRTVSRGRKAATGLGRVDMVPAGRGGGHEGTAAVAAETGDRGTSPPIFFRGGEKGM